ncbi:hypothetical protein KUTeg_021654 [Tegillarca granosa]|uniref:REM-1 domain-containing protein n=1 Tax=Tegillarca granosa TaxID=220873 RepID=A0ABQ9E9H4_TEGGR|nr:hypothetical protein KUTeg_021654 [Tegillarca granosa]
MTDSSDELKNKGITTKIKFGISGDVTGISRKLVIFRISASEDLQIWRRNLAPPTIRYGFDPNLSDNDVQLKLEEIREHLKKEIRKEMKIKEGAEKLKEATSDKKSISDVQSIVKKTNNKLKELQQELQEINAYLLVSNSSTHHESMAVLITSLWQVKPITMSISVGV